MRVPRMHDIYQDDEGSLGVLVLFKCSLGRLPGLAPGSIYGCFAAIDIYQPAKTVMGVSTLASFDAACHLLHVECHDLSVCGAF
ncbi:hypothetical protein N476_06330 [Pseudoalteromonas luteoviolacea H33]|uniref:Uncharacterized protein n=1 Tax=Pseudoalteromonas luteoviolacea H33 TaxID=1365251 RepID=A0A162A5V3_9GAMM|nr:hypothetical protein N476_06330 [Pseudoalteromonas luteoviolacea H33]KZN75415.1 hypothetical protein N477_19340 [Pseudoalteromonas luteoviolacea H33-S]